MFVTFSVEMLITSFQSERNCCYCGLHKLLNTPKHEGSMVLCFYRKSILLNISAFKFSIMHPTVMVFQKGNYRNSLYCDPFVLVFP